ncbi:hypothetical protein FOA52_002224 [Chlamydomonas sp. UWO 241]|nr:hypothetical protein FOA52_002224 [Chlamydomonas sp. UWO 241]
MATCIGLKKDGTTCGLSLTGAKANINAQLCGTHNKATVGASSSGASSSGAAQRSSGAVSTSTCIGLKKDGTTCGLSLTGAKANINAQLCGTHNKAAGGASSCGAAQRSSRSADAPPMVSAKPCERCKRMVSDGHHLQKSCPGAGSWNSGTYGTQVNRTKGHRAAKEHADHVLEAQLIHVFFGDCDTSNPLHDDIFCYLNTTKNIVARGAIANKNKGAYVKKLIAVRRVHLNNGYREIRWANDGLKVDHYHVLDVQIRAAEEMVRHIPHDTIFDMIDDLKFLYSALGQRFSGYSG